MSDPVTDSIGFRAGISVGGRERLSAQKKLAKLSSACIEVADTFVAPPRASTLKRWGEQRSSGLMLALKAWQLITHEPQASPTFSRVPLPDGVAHADIGAFKASDVVREATVRMLEAVQLTGASVLMFETPPAFTPTDKNIAAVRRYFSQLSRPDGLLLAWDARGVWQASELAALCAECGVLPVIDYSAMDGAKPLSPVRVPLVYVRCRAPDYSDDELLDLADAIAASSDNALVFFSDPNNQLRLATKLASEFETHLDV